MNKKSIYWSSVFVIILTSLIFILGTDRKSYDSNPETVYQVYLNGQTIGVIENEEELHSLIDKEQKNLKKEYTILIIAHRLSTIQNADKILVIENGKIIAEGNHKQLLKNCEYYKKLYKKELEK